MKKFLAAVALAFTTLTLSAQNITVYAGLGITNLTGDDVENCEACLSYKGGVSYEVEMNDQFSVIPAGELVMKGYKRKGGDDNIKLVYVQVPVHAAYKIDIADDMNLVLKAGPYFGFGLFGSEISFGGEKQNVFDDGGFKRFDMGLSCGVGMDVSKFAIGIEFTRGLTNASDMGGDFECFNQTFGLTFGYKF